MTRIDDDAVHVLRVAQHTSSQQHLWTAAIVISIASRDGSHSDAALGGISVYPGDGPGHLVCGQAEGVGRQLQVACERVQRVVGRLALDLGSELAQRRFCVVLPPAADHESRTLCSPEVKPTG